MTFKILPQTISFKDLVSNETSSMSPSDYPTIKVNGDFEYLSKFISSIAYGKEVGGFNYMENSKVKFIRTKCLQASSFLLNMDEAIGISPLVFRNFNLVEGDILIVKDSNIGEVCYLDEDLPNYAISGGVVKINLNDELDNFYILGIMKSSFFKEQIDLMTPKGATIRHSKDSFKWAKIPIAKTQHTIARISLLTKALIRKERELRNKFEQINKLISYELKNNQKGNKFNYNMLSYKELISKNRFDIGLYSKDTQETEHLIKNYKKGSDTIVNQGFYSIRGQNLQISQIGKSISSDIYKSNFYQLFLPTHISKYGTIKKTLFLGNFRELLLVNNEDIIFGAEGFGKGRSFIPLNEKGKFITNIHGTMLRHNNAPVYKKIFIKCMLDWFRERGIIDAYAVGGNGGSFSTKYWDILHFPLFDEDKQKEISKLYYNQNDAYLDYIDNFDIETFEKIDLDVTIQSGILDLDLQIKTIKEKVDQEIKNMIK